jgi:hypothetical protein
MADKESCPLCQAILKSPREPTTRDAERIPCPRCGTYDLGGTLAAILPQHVKDDPRSAALVSHVIRRSQSAGTVPFLSAARWEEIIKNVTPPSPAEQAENLILWLGKVQPIPGERTDIRMIDRAIVGSLSDQNFYWLLHHLIRVGLLDGDLLRGEAAAAATLSYGGWEAFERLQRESPRRTHRAFMAMLYGDPLLDRIFTTCFKPAVARTGFDLVRLDEEPQAGLIDDRLRLEIRRSRFLVADLTHGSYGAYWEAGYAEGLGKPVIYTCESSEFRKRGTHFDTNHLHTVIWDEADLNAANDQLALSIRLTLPDEAKLDD